MALLGAHHILHVSRIRFNLAIRCSSVVSSVLLSDEKAPGAPELNRKRVEPKDVLDILGKTKTLILCRQSKP
jgi:hypothetical protein